MKIRSKQNEKQITAIQNWMKSIFNALDLPCSDIKQQQIG